MNRITVKIDGMMCGSAGGQERKIREERVLWVPEIEAEGGNEAMMIDKRLLGLARAFLHDAPLMLLDEPTSNLDSLNEAVILRSLHEERESRTVVLVSHRASTMRIADRVVSAESGRVS